VQRGGVGEMIADEAHMPLGMKAPVVIGYYARRFLTAMLERVQTESCQRGGVLMTKNAEHPTFLMQMIVVFGNGCARFIRHKLKLR
jgi:hypothetical protein